MPTHVRLGSAHLEKDSIVLLEQIRTIDKRRLCEYIGSVTPEEMAQIEHALLVSIGMDRKAETEAG